MKDESDRLVPELRTLSDVTEAMADIMYVYGPERSGMPGYWYERIYSAAQVDVEGKKESELTVSDMVRTRTVVDTILSEEDERIVKGRIKREAFLVWILEHVLRSYRHFVRENFRLALLKDADSGRHCW